MCHLLCSFIPPNNLIIYLLEPPTEQILTHTEMLKPNAYSTSKHLQVFQGKRVHTIPSLNHSANTRERQDNGSQRRIGDFWFPPTQYETETHNRDSTDKMRTTSRCAMRYENRMVFFFSFPFFVLNIYETELNRRKTRRRKWKRFMAQRWF